MGQLRHYVSRRIGLVN